MSAGWREREGERERERQRETEREEPGQPTQFARRGGAGGGSTGGRGVAEALAPRTHPADTLGLAKGTRSSGQGRQGAAQPRAMFTPFLVLEEVKKALEAIVQWKVEH